MTAASHPAIPLILGSAGMRLTGGAGIQTDLKSIPARVWNGRRHLSHTQNT